MSVIAERFPGFSTLLKKEVIRFWKVGFQTVAAPVLTAVLYLLIFGHVLEDHVKVYDRISYTAFLVPGLVMMSVLQFKTDTELPFDLAVQARVMGRIVQLPAQDAAEIEQHLAALRLAGVPVHDMEIRRPDLEDVFLQVMSTAATQPEGVGA